MGIVIILLLATLIGPGGNCILQDQTLAVEIYSWSQLNRASWLASLELQPLTFPNKVARSSTMTTADRFKIVKTF